MTADHMQKQKRGQSRQLLGLVQARETNWLLHLLVKISIILVDLDQSLLLL